MRTLAHCRNPDSARRAVLVIGVAVFGFVSLIVGRATAPDASGPATSSGQVDQSSGTMISRAGAIQAATAFAQVMVGPSGDASAYRDEMESIAAPAWRSRAGELADTSIDFVRTRYGQGGAIEFEPIRYRVRSYSGSEAVIDLWGVILASGPRTEAIEESWITGTVHLVLVDSEWRVAHQSSKGGPTPELLRTEEEVTAAQILTEFSEYGARNS